MEVIQKPKTVFIGCPTHNNQIDSRTAIALFQNPSQKHNTIIVIKNSSLLAHNCNELWCTALNARSKYDLKWFAMLHSDVIPEALWLDKLIDLAEQHGADLLSAVIPIKSSDGVTSTALSKPDGTGIYKRFTQTEIRDPQFPETFCISDVMPVEHIDPNHRKGCDMKLLVNTGCMIVRIDQPWSDEVYFTINDNIVKKFNQYTSEVDPEDWNFSRMVAEKGGKVMATKAIQITHMGSNGYNSHAVWGKATDQVYE